MLGCGYGTSDSPVGDRGTTKTRQDSPATGDERMLNEGSWSHTGYAVLTHIEIHRGVEISRQLSIFRN